MIVKTVCSRSVEYFWRTLPLFVSRYSLQVLPDVSLCMLVCERKGVSLRLCMNSNHSAGGGRPGGGAWAVFTCPEEEGTRMLCEEVGGASR